MPAKMFHQFICSSMMLPEHREALNRHNGELQKQEKICYPYSGEEERACWDRLLHTSLHHGTVLTITTLADTGSCQLSGVVCKVNLLQREISIKAGGKIRCIPLAGIVSIESE